MVCCERWSARKAAVEYPEERGLGRPTIPRSKM